jgi:hypothetical protein
MLQDRYSMPIGSDTNVSPMKQTVYHLDHPCVSDQILKSIR